VIAVLMPWYLGLGPAGVDLLESAGPIRSAGACNATSAVTKCTAGGAAGEAETESSVGADVKHLPRGLSVMLLEPYPWASLHGVELRLAQSGAGAVAPASRSRRWGSGGLPPST
jgi:hypothetical protein